MILFVDGMPDNNMIRFSLDSKGKQHLYLKGSTNALPFLRLGENQRMVYTLFGPKFKQPDLLMQSKPRLIFSQVTDPDTSRGALERFVHLMQKIDAPVINHPASVLRTTREQVTDTLQGIDGLRVPRTIRCKPLSPEDVYTMAAAAGIELPFIVRMAGVHGGKQMFRVDTQEDYPQLHAFPFDGRAFYISQYLDFADGSGAYHKYRIAVIGDQVISRHALVGPEWNVHGSTRKTDYFLTFPPEHERVARIEHEYLPALAGMISTIRKRLELDYFGIDCSINEDGGVTLFEANAAMNLFQNDVPGLIPVIDRIRVATRDLISSRSGMSLA